jgi:hypothetical protein
MEYNPDERVSNGPYTHHMPIDMKHSDVPTITHWAIDKRIPVALIATIVIGGVLHTLTFAWAASNLWTRVGELERQQIVAGPRLETVSKLEVKVDILTQQVSELRQSQSTQFQELKQTITNTMRR